MVATRQDFVSGSARIVDPHTGRDEDWKRQNAE